MLDLAGTVRGAAPPPWLLSRLERALPSLAAYPDQARAVRAVAQRHDRNPDEVLLTNGAAEAFALLARALTPQHALCVHPSFTEPELALRQAGHAVHHLVLDAPYELGEVPDEADLVVLGNPTNPTGVLHRGVGRLCRPGRITVVDETFAEDTPGEPESLAGRGDLPGLVVVRSLSKTWALAGLRVGYLLAAPDVVERLRQAQPAYPVSTLALTALDTCSARGPVAAAAKVAVEVAAVRDRLEAALLALGVEVTPGSNAPYLLCRVQGRSDVRELLHSEGVAVRAGATFPGLTAEHWRTAVLDEAASDRLLAALTSVL